MNVDADVNRMDACPEMDVLIAQLVMKWYRETRGDFPTVKYWMPSGHNESCWEPSVNISDAWEVVEKINSLTELPKIGSVDLVVKVGLGDNPFCEIFEKSPMGYVGQSKTFKGIVVNAPTAPLAICRAALKVVLEEP